MPFEPKLLRIDLSHSSQSSDLAATLSDEEIALPDDLQDLAEQLSVDAEHLVASYPSSSGSDFSTHDDVSYGDVSYGDVSYGDTQRWSTGLRWRMAAAAAILLACGAWSVAELSRHHSSAGITPDAMTIETMTIETATIETATTEVAHDASGTVGLRPAIAIASSHFPAAHFSTAKPVAGSDAILGVMQDHIGLPTTGQTWDRGDVFGGGSTAGCADLFQDLSAPEQEAFLDLLEDEPQDYSDLPL